MYSEDLRIPWKGRNVYLPVADPFKSAGCFLQDLQELVRELWNQHSKVSPQLWAELTPEEGSAAARTIQQLQGHRGVHVLPPVFAVSGHRNLPVRPFAGEVDANARDHGRAVLQAERGQVQTVTWRDTQPEG